MVTIELRHATHRALRDAALSADAVDSCDYLGAVGQGNGARVEVFEVAQPEVHWKRRLYQLVPWAQLTGYLQRRALAQPVDVDSK